MSAVLVAMFDSPSHANTARERLMAAGFHASAVSSTDDPTAAATAPTRSGAAEPQGAIARFFSSIFGDGNDDPADAGRAAHTSTYQAAFKRGACGVAVTTANDAEMDRAEHILNDCGAVDIDERTAWWRDELRAGLALGDSAEHRPQEVDARLAGSTYGRARGALRVFPHASQANRFNAVPSRQDRIGDTGSMFDGEPLFGAVASGTDRLDIDADADSGAAENRDPLTGERGAHPIGTGVGAAAGGLAAGALAGSVVGPVGTVIGAALGAIAGGLAGKDVAEMTDPTISETKNTS